MNDPRAKVWKAIEDIAKELPEQAEALEGYKEKLKEYVELQINKTTESLATAKKYEEQLEAIQGERDALVKQIEEKEGQKVGPSAELMEAQKKIAELEAKWTEAEQKAAEQSQQAFFSSVKSDFLKGANLKDDFAESKIDLLIATKAIAKAEDGTTEINYNGNKYTVDSFTEHLREAHPSQLKVVEGGKKGNFSSDTPPATNKAQELAGSIVSGTRGLVQFKGV